MMSLGCPKNLVDGEVMLGRLQQAGHRVVTDAAEADVLVVNTCAFIEQAREESIDKILELARVKARRQGRRLVVTGCMAERYTRELAEEIPEIDALVGTGAIDRFDDALEDSPADRPNVLLILVDDLKPSFGAYGDSFVHSPNLDRLAARGLRFDMAYCNQAVCAPSRNNLMTASRSTSLGVYSLGYHFRKAEPDAVTMPQYFKQHGYHAAGIGKVFHIGHGNVDDEQSWSVPFHPDKVIDYVLPESNGGKLTREEAFFSNQKLGQVKSLPRGAAWEKADVDDGAYADGRIADEGIRRLRKAKQSDQPLFLALGFTKPHLPFCAPRKYWDLYDPADIHLPTNAELPDGMPEMAATNWGELRKYDGVPADGPLDDAAARRLIHGYYACVSYVDTLVGRLLEELERSGLRDNTIVVLWGDHGWKLGEHGLWCKHTNFELDCRAPLIVSDPSVGAGADTNALVEFVDIYP